MSKIATWGEVNTLVGSTIGSPANQCPTKAQLAATSRVVIAGSYASNQLVQLADISKATPATNNIITLSVSNVGNGQWRVTANAQYAVKSAVLASGMYIGSDNNDYPIAVNIAVNSTSGTGTINAPTAVTSMRFETATCVPPYDSSYNYIAQG